MSFIHKAALPLFTFILGAALATGLSAWADAGSAGAPMRVEVKPASVVHTKTADKRLHPKGAGSIRFLARGDNAFVGLLEMKGGGKVPLHADATEEYIHVLQGGGTMTIDGATHKVTAGTTVFMPAGARVSFANGPKRLVALQVFAGPAPAAKYDAWTPAKAAKKPAR